MKHLNKFKSSEIKKQYIKSVNELFDDEALKAEHEIGYLTGDLRKNIVKGKYGSFFDKYSSIPAIQKLGILLNRFINKGCHQLLVFFQKSNIDIETQLGLSNRPRIKQFKEKDIVINTKNPEGIFYVLELMNNKYQLTFGIKFLNGEKFDLFFCDTHSQELSLNLDFEDIYYFIKYRWTKLLSNFENKELIDFGESDFNRLSN